jgi:hypothetical protein
MLPQRRKERKDEESNLRSFYRKFLWAGDGPSWAALRRSTGYSPLREGVAGVGMKSRRCERRRGVLDLTFFVSAALVGRTLLAFDETHRLHPDR